MTAVAWGKALAASIQREFVVIRLAAASKHVPLAARIAAMAAVAYAFSPIDIIPNTIPVIGLLDDLVVLLLANLVIGLLAPGRVMALVRAAARDQIPDSESAPEVLGLYDWLGYRRRWRLLEALARRYVSDSAPIVVGGCGRSGTSLLRILLDRHPHVFAGLETTVFLSRVSSVDDVGKRLQTSPVTIERLQRRSRSQAEFIDLLAALCLERTGKRVWADKTPANVMRLDFIWRHFPKARFIHVIRDGRDVACSLRDSPWVKIPLDQRLSPRAMEFYADYWVKRVRRGRQHRSDPRYYEISYEALVRNPRRVLADLLDWLELPRDDSILDAMLDRSGSVSRGAPATQDLSITEWPAGRWQRDLSHSERQSVERVSGPLLRELGYLETPI